MKVRVSALILILLLASCSTAPRGPQKGTPAFYWAAANETFTKGDYTKAAEHLEALTRSEGEETPRAYPWLLTLHAGLAAGYLELADGFEAGGRANKTNPTPFRKWMNDYRTHANRHTLAFVQHFQNYRSREAGETVPLAFPSAAGSAAQNPTVSKVAQGILATETEVADAQRRVIERQILLAQARATGSGGDVARMRELVRGGQYDMPRNGFLLAMASILLDQSQLYSERKQNMPDRRKVMLDAAGDVLKALPDSPERKELEKKIAVDRKTLKS
jgi:hypothetical protein